LADITNSISMHAKSPQQGKKSDFFGRKIFFIT